MIEQSQFAELKEVKPMQFAIDHNEEGIEPGPESDDGIKDDQSAATIEKTDETSEQTQTVLDIKTFKCEYCDQKFDRDAISVAVFLYGAFFLDGTKSYYAGFNCPKCLKTLLIKANKEVMDYFYRWISSALFFGGKNSYPIDLRYYSLGQSLLLDSEELRGVNHITKLYTVHGTFWENVQSQIRSDYFDGYSSSFFYDENAPIGSAMTMLYIAEDQIEALVQIENKTNKQLIPRYIHNLPIYGTIDDFCWDYVLALRYHQSVRSYYAKVIERIKNTDEYQAASDDDEKQDELLGSYELAYETHHSIVKRLKESIEKESVNVPLRFGEVLTKRLNAFNLPIIESHSCRKVWGTIHPFRDDGFPHDFFRIASEADKLSTLQANDNTILNDLSELLRKGYGKQYLIDSHLKFISEYFELINSACWSYAAVEELLGRYRHEALVAMKTDAINDKPYAFFPEGDTWTIRYKGNTIRGLRNVGLRYIQYLLQHPNKVISTVDLNLLNGVDASKIESVYIKTIDWDEWKKNNITDLSKSKGIGRNKKGPDKIATIKRRIDEIDEELPRVRHDFIRVDELEEERDKLTVQLEIEENKAENLPNNQDRAQGAVSQAIRRAIIEIRGKHKKDQTPLRKEVADHLNASLKPINSPIQCYRPLEEIYWHFK